mmetsp:Transcript_20915/g.67696  ORF Transcript_20915/g.67696 Transcript_20915/m.67696 type:complete len:273 (+) Transcript_20915:409-1227(+)
MGEGKRRGVEPSLRNAHLRRPHQPELARARVEAVRRGGVVILIYRKKGASVPREADILGAGAVVAVAGGRRVRLERKVGLARLEGFADGQRIDVEGVASHVAHHEPLAARVHRAPVRVRLVLRRALRPTERLGRCALFHLLHLFGDALVCREGEPWLGKRPRLHVHRERAHGGADEVIAICNRLGHVERDEDGPHAPRRGHRLGRRGRAHRLVRHEASLVVRIHEVSGDPIFARDGEEPCPRRVHSLHERYQCALGKRHLLHQRELRTVVAQ